MDKKGWLTAAAGMSFCMAAFQLVVSIFPAAAAYFEAPAELLQNPLLLFLVGGGAALILVMFGLYALSGASTIRRLPLLRLGLIGISALFLLRGVLYPPDRADPPGNDRRRNPDPGGPLPPGIFGRGDYLCSRDGFELERHAAEPLKLWLLCPVGRTQSGPYGDCGRAMRKVIAPGVRGSQKAKTC